MSALAVQRRALMTPEEELELLIAEQTADDTTFVYPDPNVISLDAPSGFGTIGDLIGTDEHGEVICFFHPREATLFDAQKSQHGTIYGYMKLRCRCVLCSAANAKYHREYRARKREQS
jgi:hypothetical protein